MKIEELSSSEHAGIIAKIVARGKEVLPAGSLLCLYGSRARGDYRADSDWDLLLLLDKEVINERDHEKYSYPLFELGWEIGAQIHPMMFTKKEWERRRMTPLYDNISREGIVLC